MYNIITIPQHATHSLYQLCTFLPGHHWPRDNNQTGSTQHQHPTEHNRLIPYKRRRAKQPSSDRRPDKVRKRSQEQRHTHIDPTKRHPLSLHINPTITDNNTYPISFTLSINTAVSGGIKLMTVNSDIRSSASPSQIQRHTSTYMHQKWIRIGCWRWSPLPCSWSPTLQRRGSRSQTQ